jgi:enoyl-CoA hydratase
MSMRPIASRFRAATSALPAIARTYSAWSVKSYEFIQTTEPRPGVGQSTSSSHLLLPVNH